MASSITVEQGIRMKRINHMKSNSILNVDTKVISRSSYMILQQQRNEENIHSTIVNAYFLKSYLINLISLAAPRIGI